jgi:hypothetical protein
MPIKQVKKGNVEGSLAYPNTSSKYKADGQLKKAALFKVDIAGNITKDIFAPFLLNPTSIEESKSANWVEQAVPGQSDPILQWISSGARTVTFDVLVTADTSDYYLAESNDDAKQAQPKTAKEAIATLAAKLFKVQVPPPRKNQARVTPALNIENYLNYYRSLLYPEYTDPNSKGVPQRLKASPPLLVLLMGNTLSNLPVDARITNKHDVWVLRDLRIRVTKQLPNLNPMEAVVTFTLTQYNIRSFDSGRFY